VKLLSPLPEDHGHTLSNVGPGMHCRFCKLSPRLTAQLSVVCILKGCLLFQPPEAELSDGAFFVFLGA